MFKTHGLTKIPEYRCWSSMRGRCGDKKNALYGGKGIKVCERWNDFKNFLEDMGPRPSCKHSLDRIDSHGNYEPSNCRWATRTQQNNNRKNVNILTLNGVTKTISDWADHFKMNNGTIRSRINRGWPVEKALFNGLRRGGTFCRRGHLFTKETTAYKPNGERYCAPCDKKRRSSRIAALRSKGEEQE